MDVEIARALSMRAEIVLRRRGADRNRPWGADTSLQSDGEFSRPAARQVEREIVLNLFDSRRDCRLAKRVQHAKGITLEWPTAHQSSLQDTM
jgi:hypothetical protein